MLYEPCGSSNTEKSAKFLSSVVLRGTPKKRNNAMLAEEFL